jgi:alkanesulfonate monooxygenase SsuD/methylene tetrahydromethanopterin reductase-like flavin-dependent oxidoreductase (luciferase family)
LQKPYVMLGVNVTAADTDEEARFLFTSAQQMFVNVRRGHPGPLPPPREGVLEELAPWERAGMEEMLAAAIVGGPETVRRGVTSFVERTSADELMVVTPIFEHAQRLHSFEVLMQAMR